MRAFLFIVAMVAAMGAAQTALARGGGHGGHGAAPHPARQPPRRQPPAPQGWAKVGKHVYTTATWRGGRKGSWSTDVPF